MAAAIELLIVDGHRMFREGIRQRLERDPRFEVVGEASGTRVTRFGHCRADR